MIRADASIYVVPDARMISRHSYRHAMRQDTERTLARQWALLRAIPAWPRKVAVTNLIEVLADRGIAVTRRTVERDLQALVHEFPLYVDDTSKPYGWCWAKGARQEFTPSLSTSQSVALLLSKSHLRNLLPQAMLKDLAPIFDAAEREIAATGWKDWHKNTAVIPSSLALLPPVLDKTILSDVQTALARGRCLAAHYRSKGSDTPKEVTIQPLGLLVRGPIQYLVCTMFDYTDVRQLAIHRLSRTTVLATPRKKPAGFEFQKYVAAASKFNTQGTIRLVARFDEAAAEHLKETPVSKDQVLKPLEGTSRIELIANVESDETLRWWLHAFGDQVEVMEPTSLRNEFADHARNIMAHYWPSSINQMIRGDTQ